jgi:Holliday junction DNA helicase RuvA
VDVGGVGYLVHTPAPLAAGEEVELVVYTQVREDAITLYGFLTEEDLSVFEALIKVTGVGPMMALNILAQLGATSVAAAIAARDTKTLTSVRGVGGKVAEKIVTLAKMPDIAVGDPRTAELVGALTDLGFERGRAHDAARIALEKHPDETEESVLIAEAVRAASGATK